MRQYVPPEQLWTEFHGDLDFEYEHETYWPALIKHCDEVRAAQKDRWIRGGKLFGESEAYLKGANVPSVGTESTKPAVSEKAEEANGSDAKEKDIAV